MISFFADIGRFAINTLFGFKAELLSHVLSMVDFVKCLFFDAAMDDVLANGTTGIFNQYVEEAVRAGYGDKWAQKVERGLSAAGVALGAIPMIMNAVTVFYPSIDDLKFFNKINTQNYYTKFVLYNEDISMEDILNRCEIDTE